MNTIEKIGLVFFMISMSLWTDESIRQEWATLLTGLRLIGACLFVFGDIFTKKASES